MGQISYRGVFQRGVAKAIDSSMHRCLPIPRLQVDVTKSVPGFSPQYPHAVRFSVNPLPVTRRCTITWFKAQQQITRREAHSRLLTLEIVSARENQHLFRPFVIFAGDCAPNVFLSVDNGASAGY
jgi:hypothetical protein